MSKNKENYIKSIYELGGGAEIVNNKDISTILRVTASSVSEMIKKLVEEGYIIYVPYKGVRLTEYGVEEAVKVLRKHRLWEVFLVNYLGYKWHEVHEEAEMLEHFASEKFENRLDEFLNHPEACPHGNPIPLNAIHKNNYRKLDSLSIGEESVLKRVTDERELLKYVVSLGLGIGDYIKVVDVALYNGPITLNKNGTEIIIGKEAAGKIFVD